MAGLVAVSYLALIAVLIIPNEFEYPAILMGLFLYPAMQWACPECRLDLAQPITPLNWAQLLFFLQTIVLPLMITFFGPARSTLPYLASAFSINAAVVLVNMSYVAFCMGYQWLASRRKATVSASRSVDPSKSLVYVLANFAAGFIGLFCTFGSLAGLVRYFTDPAEHRLAVVESGITLSGAAGTFLKPFLGFAFIVTWCNWVDRWGRQGSTARRSAVSAVPIAPALISFATFNYNRGSFVAPLMSITAVYLARVQRVSLVTLAGFGSVVLGRHPHRPLPRWRRRDE